MIQLISAKNQTDSNTNISMIGSSSNKAAPSGAIKDTMLNASSTTQDLSFGSFCDSDSSSFSSQEGPQKPDHPRPIVWNEYEVDTLTDIDTTANDKYHRQCSTCTASTVSSSSTASSNSTTSRRSVRFSVTRIREYAICPGDNPACELGVPVSLDWKVVSEETTSVDAYNATEEKYSVPLSQREELLRMAHTEREAMVRRSGFSTEDIRTAVRAVNECKMQRNQTLDKLGSNKDSWDESMERIRRGIWNATLGRSSKQMERTLLQKLQQKDVMTRRGMGMA